MIIRVPVLVGNATDWARKVATAINQLILASEAPISSVSTALPVYASNAAAVSGGLKPGDLYRLSATSGALQVVL